MALSTLFQVLLRTLVSIVVQLKWRPALDDAIAMYFPASLHSFPPCLLYQQRGILFIVPVKKYWLLFIRFITGIFGRGIGTLTVRVYRCGPLIPIPNYDYLAKCTIYFLTMSVSVMSSTPHATGLVICRRARDSRGFHRLLDGPLGERMVSWMRKALENCHSHSVLWWRSLLRSLTGRTMGEQCWIDCHPVGKAGEGGWEPCGP